MTHLVQPVTKNDHIQGRLTAPIHLVVYGDYECPYTRLAMTHVKGLQRRLGNDLCFVYRHFPAPEHIHPHAWAASEAALAAETQNKFWEMHEQLFKHQKALEIENLEAYAQTLALDLAQFRDEIHEHTHQARLQASVEGGMSSGVKTLPTFFINGVRYDGDLRLKALLATVEQTTNTNNLLSNH